VPSVFEGGIGSNGRIKLLPPPEYVAVVGSRAAARPLNLREGADIDTPRLDDGETG
jgi:hypothetical protein